MKKSLPFLVIALLVFNSSFATTFTVTNTNDSGLGSLRAAITDANADASPPHLINFTISGTVTLASGLPSITRQTTIDGTSSGATPGTPTITIDGGGSHTTLIFTSTAANCMINTLCIINSSSAGILFSGGNGGTVKGCYIGITIAGADAGNAGAGIKLNSTSDSYTIGGITASERNIISGNAGYGIEFSSTSINSTVAGNYIGTNIAGTGAIPNDLAGIYLAGGCDGNTIGGTTSASRNVISGNTSYGMDVRSGTNTIQNNYIGVNSGGNAALANGSHGISFTAGAAGGNKILNNVISGNGNATGENGINFDGGTGSAIIVKGNNIGVGADGSTAIPNFSDGIKIDNSEDVTVGGSAANEKNIISKNGRYGIYVTISSGTIIKGNYIGTNTSWANLGNTSSGIFMEGTSSASADVAQIGGTLDGEENYIGFNGGSGIENLKAYNVTIQGNYIGTNTLDAKMGNTSHGIYFQSTGTTADSGPIGAAATVPLAGEANTIAYNGGDGVSFMDDKQTRIPIRGNSIYCNGGLGIDLNNDGDGSIGNLNIAAPAVTSSTTNTASGTCVSGYAVHVYRNKAAGTGCDCEGEIYLSQVTCTGSNTWTYTHNLGLSVAEAASVTATQTDGSNNTGPFAPCATPVSCEISADFTINSTTQCLSGNSFIFTNASSSTDSTVTGGGVTNARELVIDSFNISGVTSGAYSARWQFTTNNSGEDFGAGAAGATLGNATTGSGFNLVASPYSFNAENTLRLSMNGSGAWPVNRGDATNHYAEFPITATGGPISITAINSNLRTRNGSGTFYIRVEYSLDGGTTFIPTSNIRTPDNTVYTVENFSPSAAITIPDSTTALFRLYIWSGGTKTASPLTYSWNFGDTFTSTTTSPTHAYSATGTYNVKLIATASSSCKDSITKAVTVVATPTANAGTDQTNAAMCGLTSTTLAAVAPPVGTGEWTIISGTNGSLTDASNHVSEFSGMADSSYTLRWTVSNAPCTDATDDVIISFRKNSPSADAGADQNSALCGLTTTTLAAVAPAYGIGVWSIQNGTGGTFGDDSSNVSNFSGIAGNSYTLKWTVTNAPCADSSNTVLITFPKNPSASFAGNNQNVCAGTAVLGADAPTVGTGAWSLVSGSGTITDSTSINSGVTGLGLGANVFRWTISNADCTPSSSDVTITRNACLIIADFTVSATPLCFSNPTVTYRDTSTGATGYSWDFGAGATPASANTVGPHSVTYSTPGNKNVTLTVTGPGGTDVNTKLNVVTISSIPTTADAGPDQTDSGTCGLTKVILAANAPASGTGLWTIDSGVDGSFSDKTSNLSEFSGTPGTSYLLRWTITNAPCTASFDTVRVAFRKNPTASNAGADQTGLAICGQTSTTLTANNPSIGKGKWSIFSGTGGSFSNDTLNVSDFDGTAGTAYRLVWTVSNAPCSASSDTVNVTFRKNPTASNAGADQTGLAICGQTSTALTANDPVDGKGKWTIFSGTGGSFSNDTLNVSDFDGTAGTAYRLVWTVSNAPCSASSDTVNVTFRKNPTASNAGADQTGLAICGQTSTTLTANDPVDGKGKWTIFSGTGGSFSNDTLNVSDFDGTAGTAYRLVWTVSNAPCSSSSDTVNVTFQQNATTSDAGADQDASSLCGKNSTNLTAVQPTIGTGMWTIKSGIGGSFSDTTSNTPLFSGIKGNKYTLTWTVTNAPCSQSSDSVNIQFPKHDPADFTLGKDTMICEQTTIQLKAKPGLSNYEWHNGSNAQVFFVSMAGTYSVKAIDQNGCNVSATINIAGCDHDSIYNVITPNGDGKNEYFVIRGLVPNSKLEIYNRWGSMIYAKDNYDNTWDGAGASDGIYYYIYRKNNAPRPYAGHVEIIR